MQQQPPEQARQPEPINPHPNLEGNPADSELVPPVRRPRGQDSDQGEGLLVPPAQAVQRPAPHVPPRPTAPNAAEQPREPSGDVAPLQRGRSYDHRTTTPNETTTPNKMTSPMSSGAAQGAAPDAGANAGMVPPAQSVASRPNAATPANDTGQPHEARMRDEPAAHFVTLSSVMHLPVVDLGSGRRLGRVDNIILSSDHRTVEAYISHGGFLSGTKAFPARGATIGQDAIVLPPGALERFDKRSLRGLPLAGPVTGTRLLSDTGIVLGTVTDIRMDPATAEVVGYEVNPEDRSLLDRLRHRSAVLPVAAVRRRGSDAWIVAEDDARRYLGG